jgi:hypothetical protein
MINAQESMLNECIHAQCSNALNHLTIDISLIRQLADEHCQLSILELI